MSTCYPCMYVYNVYVVQASKRLQLSVCFDVSICVFYIHMCNYKSSPRTPMLELIGIALLAVVRGIRKLLLKAGAPFNDIYVTAAAQLNRMSSSILVYL